METVTKQEEEDEIRGLVHCLSKIGSNQPTCNNCGEKFVPDKEDIEVDLPEEDYKGGNRTAHANKPDYCSKECEIADEL